MAILDNEFGAFLPTTDTFDRSLIDQLNIKDDLKDFLVRLYQTTNNISLVVNIKDTGMYVEQEFVNGQLWFQNKNLSSLSQQTPEYRQVFRRVIDFGALPNTATKNVAHGITVDANTTFTRIYATASDTTGFTSLSIPYAHATAANIVRLDVGATNVSITTGANRTNYDTCYVVLEFIRN